MYLSIMVTSGYYDFPMQIKGTVRRSEVSTLCLKKQDTKLLPITIGGGAGGGAPALPQ